jgi:hypothetical protein
MIGDTRGSRAGGGRCETKAVGRQASTGGRSRCGSGAGTNSTIMNDFRYISVDTPGVMAYELEVKHSLAMEPGKIGIKTVNVKR